MCAQRAPKTAVFDFDTDIDPASPLVTDVTPAADGSYVDVAFSKYMLASTLTGSTITVSNRVGGATGDTVEGSISAVNPVLVGGVQLASSARFTPDEKFEAGGEYEVWVNAVVQSYAGSPMAAAATMALLGGIDPLLLGVYRQDEHNPSRWVYVVGVVDVNEGTVTVWLSGFSRYAVMAKGVVFSDTATHWARESIQTLAARDLVHGVTETTFEPDRHITRAELAKMLVLMKMRSPADDIAFEVPQVPTFADVGPDTWYFPYVETAAANGIVEGENGLFKPTDPVTRQELAAMVVRAMGLQEKADLLKDRNRKFDDAAEVSPSAHGYLGLALFKGLIRGVTDTTLEPLSSATRAQAAAVTLRATERLGLVSTLKDIGGVLRVSDVEGRHFELDTLVDGSPVTYVLIPDGGMDGVIAKRLEGQVGKRIDVSGVLEDGVSMFMSGPVLRVLNVILPG